MKKPRQKIRGQVATNAREGVTTLSLDPEVRKAVEGLAQADDRSLSNYVNRLLKEHVIEKGALVREPEAA